MWNYHPLWGVQTRVEVRPDSPEVTAANEQGPPSLPVCSRVCPRLHRSLSTVNPACALLSAVCPYSINIMRLVAVVVVVVVVVVVKLRWWWWWWWW